MGFYSNKTAHHLTAVMAPVLKWFLFCSCLLHATYVHGASVSGVNNRSKRSDALEDHTGHDHGSHGGHKEPEVIVGNERKDHEDHEDHEGQEGQEGHEDHEGHEEYEDYEYYDDYDDYEVHEGHDYGTPNTCTVNKDGHHLDCSDYSLATLPYKVEYASVKELQITGEFTKITIDSGFKNIRNIVLRSSSSVGSHFKLANYTAFAGSLDGISLEGNFHCANLEQAKLFSSLEYLDISQTSIEEFDASFRDFPALKKLVLIGNNLKSFNLTDLPKSLNRLDLSSNTFGEMTVGPLGAGSPLEVDLSNCELTNIDFNAGAEDDRHLLNLNLAYNELEDGLSGSLRGFRSLKDLVFDNNGVSELNLTALPASIETLSLVGNYISEFDFAAAEELVNLREINLDDNKLEGIILNEDDSERLRSLTSIRLSKNRLQQIRGHFSVFPALEEIDLQANELRQVDLRGFLSATLVKLNLAGNPLQTLDIKPLAVTDGAWREVVVGDVEEPCSLVNGGESIRLECRSESPGIYKRVEADAWPALEMGVQEGAYYVRSATAATAAAAGLGHRAAVFTACMAMLAVLAST